MIANQRQRPGKPTQDMHNFLISATTIPRLVRMLT